MQKYIAWGEAMQMQGLLMYLRRYSTSLGGLVLLALCLRLVVLFLTPGLEYDIASYHIQAQSVFAHRNIYLFTSRYPYPPVWVWWVALAQWLSETTALPFVWLVKVPAILGDSLIVALLYRYKSVGVAFFYAVNPISILVTAGHGQFDGLVIALAVLAWACWRSPNPAGVYWAALALGGAIALKGYPVLLLPALLLVIPSARRRLIAGALALAPLLVSFVVYSAFFGLEGAMISRLLIYNSPLDFGWSFYVPLFIDAFWPAAFPVVMLILALAARIALLLLAYLLPRRRPTWPLERLWLVILLGFYVLAPGVSAQYLLWVLPFLALLDLKQGWWYTAVSTLGTWIFYVATNPGAVPWGQNQQDLNPTLWFQSFVVINLACWFFWLALWRRWIRSDKQVSGRSNSSAAVAAGSALPEAQQQTTPAI
jgi:hypothetical protein